jgi:hypothetical protein
MTDPTPPTANPIAAFIATKTGVSITLLTTAFAIAGPIIAHKRAYDKGQADYEQALREGTAELDGKVVTVLDEADFTARLAAATLAGEAAGFQAAQTEFLNRLDQADENHARTIADLAGRSYTPIERDWRSTAVPDAIGLRIDNAFAARADRDVERGLPAVELGSGLAGGSPSDTDAENDQ